MTFSVLDKVVLNRDLPEHGLKRGDFGAIVEIYGLVGLEVEFVTVSGQTNAVLTLSATDVRQAGDADLLTVREPTK
ncbi:MAG: DUF4926 domain-containing protein [Acidobacteria bacterium]|nr:DUF4926 domain-containing protein [Acidobacteriota bacterium]MBV9071400.1 DUF4926 domain-containing protein [Acidobacteriota bacterium]MBV9186445.1 DUF4926 domain-containing protein [Acidobacteriota bacterium]